MKTHRLVRDILLRARTNLDRVARVPNYYEHESLPSLSRAYVALSKLWVHGMSEDPLRRSKPAHSAEEWLDVAYGPYNASACALRPSDAWSNDAKGLFHFVVGDLNLRDGKYHLLERAAEHYALALQHLGPDAVEWRIRVAARRLQALGQLYTGPLLFESMVPTLTWALAEGLAACSEEARVELALSYADALVVCRAPDATPTDTELDAMAGAFDRGAGILERLCADGAALPYRKGSGWLAIASVAHYVGDRVDLSRFASLAEVPEVHELRAYAARRAVAQDDGFCYPHSLVASRSVLQGLTRGCAERLTAGGLRWCGCPVCAGS